jgi:hypothetical protein
VVEEMLALRNGVNVALFLHTVFFGTVSVRGFVLPARGSAVSLSAPKLSTPFAPKATSVDIEATKDQVHMRWCIAYTHLYVSPPQSHAHNCLCISRHNQLYTQILSSIKARVESGKSDLKFAEMVQVRLLTSRKKQNIVVKTASPQDFLMEYADSVKESGMDGLDATYLHWMCILTQIEQV